MRQPEKERYRERLLALEERLRGDVEQLRTEIAAEGQEHLAHLTEHAADHDTEGLGPTVSMEENQARILRLVEDALGRLEQGRFGACEDCGRPIGTARLEAIPYTPVCIACEREREKAGRA